VIAFLLVLMLPTTLGVVAVGAVWWLYKRPAGDAEDGSQAKRLLSTQGGH